MSGNSASGGAAKEFLEGFVGFEFGLVLSRKQHRGDVASPQDFFLLVLAKLDAELLLDAFVADANVNVADEDVDAATRLDHALRQRTKVVASPGKLLQPMSFV